MIERRKDVFLHQFFFSLELIDFFFTQLKVMRLGHAAILLSAILWCSFTTCVVGINVSTADDLIKLFDGATGNTLKSVIELLADLNFSGSSLTLPFGTFSNGTCAPFSGTLKGNGHSVKSLIMNNQNNEGYKDAGLFCSLKGATVENLVIDSSCSFTGESAGALSVSMGGSLSVINTTNKAAVSGSMRVGGFIGYAEELKEATAVSFKDCVNDGNVNAIQNIGGFVGYIFNNTGMNMAISNSTNNGNVTGISGETGGFVGCTEGNSRMFLTVYNSKNNGIVRGKGNSVGGFFGDIAENSDMTMTISNSVNNGIVNESTNYVGGFVGSIGSYPGMTVTISNSVNNGDVRAVFNNVGGFVGCIYDGSYRTSIPITISNSTNNGNVTGYDYTGGFIGNIFTFSQASPMLLEITSSENKGNVSAVRGMACGFVCSEVVENIYVNTTIMNSINKGSVNASTYGYGITNNATVVRNVVSMGDVAGSSGSYTFWKTSIDAQLFYGLDGRCTPNAIPFQYNDNTGFYEVAESGQRVDYLLSNESFNKQFGMVWSSELGLASELLFVEVCGVFSQTFSVGPGTPLGDVRKLSEYFSDEQFGVVSYGNESRVVYKSTHLVSRNMSVLVGNLVSVSVGAPINKNERIVIGETLEQLARFLNFSFDDFIVMEKESEQMLNQSSIIERDTELKVCHNVTVSGTLNESFVIEHGTKLGDISNLTDYFNSSFVVYHSDDADSVVISDTLVLRDIVIVITRVSNQDIELKFDDKENITEEDVKNAVKDLVPPGNRHVWIEVIPQGDNLFIISVKQTGAEDVDLAESLKECSLSNL